MRAIQRCKFLVPIASLCAALAAAPAAFGQTYPSKPIRLVVPYPAGGATDFVARLFGEHYADPLHATMVHSD